MKKIILISIILLILFLIIPLTQITGRVTSEYSFTKAICDKSNLCQDYEIACRNKQILDIKPLGNPVQFSSDWKDPRTKEQIEKLCDK